MQYGRAVYHLIREVVIADLALGPIYVLKADASNGFYHIGMQPRDTLKLGLV